MIASERPKVLFVAAEAFPLAKTGGLGDVCSALPAMLARLGVDIRLMIPGYPQALDTALQKRELATVSHPTFGTGRLIAGYMPDSGLPVLLFEAPSLFSRPGGLYQDPQGQDWADNYRRFAAFCHAAAGVALGRAGTAWRPNVVHANDWHTGLLAALLHQNSMPRPRTVFTIHNLAFQGNFPPEVHPELDLGSALMSSDGVEFYGQLSFLKAGLRYSDRLTTVSPNYAREILTPQHGCGMDGLLRARQSELVGILNGVNYDIWCPSKDAQLPFRYTPEELGGKDGCKSALREELGLSTDRKSPLVIYANRLTNQKMADALIESIPAAIAGGAQVVVHGEGEQAIEKTLREMQRDYPAQLAVCIGYDEALAHRLHAAADLALTPARFEPCGLTTMYAMRYGAVPVTRNVGGLADTVENAGITEDRAPQGTGFVFSAASAAALTASIYRAVEWYRNDEAWRPLQLRAMRRDFGWERSARQYHALYQEMLVAENKLADRLPVLEPSNALMEVA